MKQGMKCVIVDNECAMLWAIWCYMYNLKNEKNTHGGVVLLVKLKVILLHGCFWRFLNWYKWHQIAQSIILDSYSLWELRKFDALKWWASLSKYLITILCLIQTLFMELGTLFYKNTSYLIDFNNCSDSIH